MRKNKKKAGPLDRLDQLKKKYLEASPAAKRDLGLAIFEYFVFHPLNQPKRRPLKKKRAA